MGKTTRHPPRADHDIDLEERIMRTLSDRHRPFGLPSLVDGIACVDRCVAAACGCTLRTTTPLEWPAPREHCPAYRVVLPLSDA